MRTHWLICLVAVGCSQVEDTSEDLQSVGGGGHCPPWVCANSPEVMLNGMHDANLRGLPNKQGIWLEGVSPKSRVPAIFVGGVPYKLLVSPRWNKLGAQTPGGTLQGAQLVGAELHLLYENRPLVNIRIDSVREIAFPIGDPFPIEVYKLSWYEPWTGGQIGKNVCNGPEATDAKNDLLGMAKDETLVFVGDRIDGDRLTIADDPDNVWLNFGCAGRTLAKLFLTRNTNASGSQNPRANQATLKMMAADYCGKGEPITMSGTPIRWQGGLVQYMPTPDKIEARWDENGARCVNDLRLEANPNPDFPDPRAKLMSFCKPPPCTNTNLYDFDGALRVSAIPMP
jgi:hypothetical protein